MKAKREQMFAVLAILVVVLGHSLIESGSTMTTAAVSKTSTTTADNTNNETTTTSSTTKTTNASSITTANTTSTKPTGSSKPSTTGTASTSPFVGNAIMTSPSPNNRTTNTTPDNATTTSVSDTTTTSSAQQTNNTTSSNTHLITTMQTNSSSANSLSTPTSNFTSPPNMTTSAEQMIKPQAEIISIGQQRVLIKNTGAVPLSVSVELKSKLLSLPNEEAVRRLVTEAVMADKTTSPPEVEISKIGVPGREVLEVINQKVEAIKSIEENEVQPLYIRKVYQPLEKMTGSSVSEISYTGQPTSGTLLFPELMPVPPTQIQPRQQATIPIAIKKPIGREQQVMVRFVSQGQEIGLQEITLPESSTGTALDLNTRRHLFDLYLYINPLTNASQNYYVELSLTELNLTTSKKTPYLELLGPYKTQGKSQLFSQQFSYNPAAHKGDYTLTAKIFQNTGLVATDQFLVRLGK